MEQWDDLLLNGWSILQQHDKFCFGTDAVLLYDLIPAGCGQTVDLCSGNGAVALMLLAGKKTEQVTAVELQADALDLCRQSAVKNGCSHQLDALCADICDVPTLLSAASADTVCVNPPYFKKDSGILPTDQSVALCRHELACTIEDVFSAARHLLKPGGKFYMVHRVSRQQEILQKIENFGLHPIHIRRIFSMPCVPSKLFLLVAEKGSKSKGCKYSDFTVLNADGSLSEAYQAIYSKGV